MAKKSTNPTGMRQIKPGVWELIVEAGKDPVTGKYRQVTRRFHGGVRDAKAARSKLLTEAQQGRHTGTQATVDHVCAEWLKELERKGRSPRTVAEYRRCYERDIRNYLGTKPVAKVTTKMLTDLYGAHQQRGASPASVHKIHATISSMMSQACRWGWRDTNPATWADPPPIEQVAPVVPSPEEVLKLINGARSSRRPIYAKVIFFAATTGIRRGEICALRRSRLDAANGTVTIARNIVKHQGQKVEKTTKNRKHRAVALDSRSLQILVDQIEYVDRRAVSAKETLVDDPYIFTDCLIGSEP